MIYQTLYVISLTSILSVCYLFRSLRQEETTYSYSPYYYYVLATYCDLLQLTVQSKGITPTYSYSPYYYYVLATYCDLRQLTVQSKGITPTRIIFYPTFFVQEHFGLELYLHCVSYIMPDRTKGG